MMNQESRIAALAQGKFVEGVLRNADPSKLYEESILYDKGQITQSGGLASFSGNKTGRSPKDKRIVMQDSIKDDVWWGEVNMPLEESAFAQAKQRAVDFLDNCEHFYVLDAFAGWDPASQLKIRVICSRAYHALFMHNMLIRPTPEQLADFGEPDYVIYNAGQQLADTSIEGIDSTASVSLNFDSGEMVILGTEYAGEMKKGVFTIMNYLMPKKDVLSMHCSCNVGEKHDVRCSLVFLEPARPPYPQTAAENSLATTNTAGTVAVSSTSKAVATPSALTCQPKKNLRSSTRFATVPF